MFRCCWHQNILLKSKSSILFNRLLITFHDSHIENRAVLSMFATASSGLNSVCNRSSYHYATTEPLCSYVNRMCKECGPESVASSTSPDNTLCWIIDQPTKWGLLVHWQFLSCNFSPPGICMWLQILPNDMPLRSITTGKSCQTPRCLNFSNINQLLRKAWVNTASVTMYRQNFACFYWFAL